MRTNCNKQSKAHSKDWGGGTRGEREEVQCGPLLDCVSNHQRRPLQPVASWFIAACGSVELEIRISNPLKVCGD